MSWTTLRYVTSTFLRSFFGIFFLLLSVFLVADFVDRARMYTGERWVRDALLLYFFKAQVVTHQLAPASLLLAAGVTVSLLRKRGELTAMRSLGMGPAFVYLPIGVCALVFSALLVLYEEQVMIRAAFQVDDITLRRFNRWGDWRFYYTPKRWFRKGNRIFHLRGGDLEQGFENSTVFTLTPSFDLAERMDAKLIRPLGGTRWELSGTLKRRFHQNGRVALSAADRLEVDLGINATAFQVRPGRPEQMRLPVLAEQIAIREDVGLPTRQFVLAQHNRFAYSLAGFPAALLTIGLALRPGRKGHLTLAIVEGLAVALTLWGVIIVCRGLSNAEHVAPALAAWAPVGILVALAALLGMRREGRLGWRGM